ncbi:MAG: 5-oxoprolinase subunit PxpB [Desulfobacterales bacterium]|nr:5-oxoprolinase subunit PxpB [Desulfobacterales bacterium]
MKMKNGMYQKPLFRIAGDRGLLAEYGNIIDPDINARVRTVAIAITKEPPVGVLEIIPSYRSLVIIYDPFRTTISALKDALLAIEKRISEIKIPPPETVEIPVCYGHEFGPDIEFVAGTHDLTADDVVKIHSDPLYPIYMIGFTPGFPFLGGLSERLHTPRLATPRTSVPAGSVGIANNQTGIYPITSPGGWQIIGRTPLKLFDPERSNPFLLKAGDMLKFKPVPLEEFHSLAEKDRKGEFPRS